MEMFTRFNRKSIYDRQIDTLIGLSKGLLADGQVNQVEAEFLMSWLVQSRQASDNPIILNLLDKVDSMLEDGVLDAEESMELFGILQKITGESSELGELAKSKDGAKQEKETSDMEGLEMPLLANLVANYRQKFKVGISAEALRGYCLSVG